MRDIESSVVQDAQMGLLSVNYSLSIEQYTLWFCVVFRSLSLAVSVCFEF